MSTLLQRLAERAQGRPGARLHPLAAAPFADLAAPVPEPEEETRMAEAGPAPPARYRPAPPLAPAAPPEHRVSGASEGRARSQARPGPLAEPSPPDGLSAAAPAAASAAGGGLLMPAAAGTSVPVRPPLPAVPPAGAEPQPPSLMPPPRRPPVRERAVDMPAPPRGAGPERNGQDERARAAARAAVGPARTSPLPATVPEVHIHIGRVEVRPAAAAAVPARPAAARAAAPSLDDYLARRGSGQ